MWSIIHLSALSGLLIITIMLFAATILSWLGVSYGEALYVSLSGLVGIGYGVISWQQRRGK